MSDANPHRGEVSLKLLTRASDGVTAEREVTLRPTFAALVAIERETGMGLIQLVSRIRAGSIAHLPTVIREGARAADQEVAPDEVERAIAAQGAFPIIEAANRFLTGAVIGGSSEKNADTAEATTR